MTIQNHFMYKEFKSTYLTVSKAKTALLSTELQ